MPVLVLICTVVLHRQADALLQTGELESGEKALQSLVAHALPMLTVSLGRIEDDLSVAKLLCNGMREIGNRVLFFWKEGQWLACPRKLIARAIERDPKKQQGQVWRVAELPQWCP